MHKVSNEVLVELTEVLDIMTGVRPMVKTENTISIAKKAMKLSKLIKDNYTEVEI